MTARKGKRAGLDGQAGARRRRKLRQARLGVRKCRRCGCTENSACDGGCWWVDVDLCSRCNGEKTLFAELVKQGTHWGGEGGLW